MKKHLFLIATFIYFTSNAQVRVLFDATKAEMAGNADWVVDADLFNLGYNSTGAMVVGASNEANPQRIPTLAQSGITSSTAETYWKGALSNWGVDLVRRGYTIETLPYNGQITYGVTTNAQDLTNYKVFIMVEPNIRFTTAEKSALMSFVQNGGGLFLIGNHNGSDRNNDGYDAARVLNDFFNSNPVRSNPFGFTFDAANISLTSTNVLSVTTNSILKGPAGNVTSLQFNSGNTMTLNRTANSAVKGLIYRTGYSTSGTTQVMFCSSTYGNGRVCGLGDSSPPDDGTGDSNDALYSSYRTAVSGNHQRLLINAVMWLAGTTPLSPVEDPSPTVDRMSYKSDAAVFPNPADDRINISGLPFGDQFRLVLNDLTGRQILDQVVIATPSGIELPIDRQQVPAGIYLLNVIGIQERNVFRVVLQ
ncbi:MAG: hypothetical protein RL021_1436 [Bacteroidota bacterium]|jgi:hypothetical protein